MNKTEINRELINKYINEPNYPGGFFRASVQYYYEKGRATGSLFENLNKMLGEKAQGLFTREEVREYIKAAVSIGGRNPGIETDAGKVADTILPAPPDSQNKTKDNE